MPSAEDAIKKVQEYEGNYRNPILEAFDISEPYALFPGEGTSFPKWPQPYPNGERPGVYLIFSDDMELLNVGKASMNNSLASRLWAYFTYEEDRQTCKIKHGSAWSKRPCYLITVAVPADSSFEAPALEEFLIKEFGAKLPDNKVGTG